MTTLARSAAGIGRGDRQIQVPVAGEIADRQGERLAADRVIHSRLERAVAVVQQHRHVAGKAGALFLGGFELFYRPFRLAPVALILLLVATVMSREQQRLIKVAFAAVGIGFVVGAALQVLTHHPLY